MKTPEPEVYQEALKLFRMIHGSGDGGSEHEFLCQTGQTEWLRLAKYCLGLKADGKAQGKIEALRDARAWCSGAHSLAEAHTDIELAIQRLELELKTK